MRAIAQIPLSPARRALGAQASCVDHHESCCAMKKSFSVSRDKHFSFGRIELTLFNGRVRYVQFGAAYA